MLFITVFCWWSSYENVLEYRLIIDHERELIFNVSEYGGNFAVKGAGPGSEGFSVESYLKLEKHHFYDGEMRLQNIMICIKIGQHGPTFLYLSYSPYTVLFAQVKILVEVFLSKYRYMYY